MSRSGIQEMHFCGQPFFIDWDHMTMNFWLEKPMQARKKLKPDIRDLLGKDPFKNWEEKLMGVQAVGVNIVALRYAVINLLGMVIHYEGKQYAGSPEKWIDFAKEKKSIIPLSGGSVYIYVYPMVPPFLEDKGSDHNSMLSDYLKGGSSDE